MERNQMEEMQTQEPMEQPVQQERPMRREQAQAGAERLRTLWRKPPNASRPPAAKAIPYMTSAQPLRRGSGAHDAGACPCAGLL